MLFDLRFSTWGIDPTIVRPRISNMGNRILVLPVDSLVHSAGGLSAQSLSAGWVSWTTTRPSLLSTKVPLSRWKASAGGRGVNCSWVFTQLLAGRAQVVRAINAQQEGELQISSRSGQLCVIHTFVWVGDLRWGERCDHVVGSGVEWTGRPASIGGHGSFHYGRPLSPPRPLFRRHNNNMLTQIK